MDRATGLRAAVLIDLSLANCFKDALVRYIGSIAAHHHETARRACHRWTASSRVPLAHYLQVPVHITASLETGIYSRLQIIQRRSTWTRNRIRAIHLLQQSRALRASYDKAAVLDQRSWPFSTEKVQLAKRQEKLLVVCGSA